jgi:hypothetical protein
MAFGQIDFAIKICLLFLYRIGGNHVTNEKIYAVVLAEEPVMQLSLAVSSAYRP